jgi:hypothetical protein
VIDIGLHSIPGRSGSTGERPAARAACGVRVAAGNERDVWDIAPRTLAALKALSAGHPRARWIEIEPFRYMLETWIEKYLDVHFDTRQEAIQDFGTGD